MLWQYRLQRGNIARSADESKAARQKIKYLSVNEWPQNNVLLDEHVYIRHDISYDNFKSCVLSRLVR